MSTFKAFEETLSERLRSFRQREVAFRGGRVPYQRRSILAVPGLRVPPNAQVDVDANLARLAKVSALPVDAFFFDLEDAAPDHPEHKRLARELVVRALRALGPVDTAGGRQIRGLRVNSTRSPLFERDFIGAVAEAGACVDFIVLPKAESADEVREVASMLSDLKALAGVEHPLGLEVLVESAALARELDELAQIDGVHALVLGSWDLARTTGMKMDEATWLDDLRMVRQSLCLAAAAHGKDAVDAITATLPIRPRPTTEEEEREAHGLASGALKHWSELSPGAHRDAWEARERALGLVERDAKDAARLGFAAKWVLHPAQVAPVQAAFSPSQLEVDDALERAIAYALAAKRGSGAEVWRGTLVDKAVVAADAWTLKRGQRAGLISPTELPADISLDELIGFALRPPSAH